MKTRSNLETGRQEKLIRKTGIEEIRKGIYKTGNNNFLRSCFPHSSFLGSDESVNHLANVKSDFAGCT